MQNNDEKQLLEVKSLKTYFPIKKGILKKTVGYVKAVDDVSFSIAKGKTFGLVGESGCGKTTAAQTIAKLITPTEGRIYFENHDIFNQNSLELKNYRQQVSVIFQDPYGSLNPRMTIGHIIGEPIKIHTKFKTKDINTKVCRLLERVGLSPNYINRYPHEFSGGQRQRIGIARALALEPKLVICDEPVSALDVSIQSQVLNLLKDLQDEFNLTYLFIAHDLAVVEFISDVVGVMYLGHIVEKANSTDIYANTLHPYTKLLLSAIPNNEFGKKQRTEKLTGEIPSPSNPPKGCPFHPRCPIATAQCRTESPHLKDRGGEHLVACWNC